MSAWSFSPSPQSPASDAPVKMLLAAPEAARVDAWHAALTADARFHVVGMATSAPDLAAKLALRPEALVVDAMLFRSPAELVQGLTRFAGAAFVLLPAQTTPAEVEQVRKVICVKDGFLGDFNLTAAAGKIYDTVLALRQASGQWERSLPAASGAGLTGVRIIAVWNQIGGAGKTTVSTNLAFEARRRGLKTLLVGLGAPDDLPLVLGLKAQPNIHAWLANPTDAGLRAAIQSANGLDVVAGFVDILSATHATALPADAPESLSRLVVAATYAGYAVVILDAPPAELAAHAVAAANTLLLVARPTLADAMRTAEAFTTVVEKMAGQHRIPPDGIRVVLNRARASNLLPKDFHEAASRLRKNFPPIVAAIPDDPRVEEAQNRRELPLLSAAEFQRGLMPLAEAILPTPRGESPAPDGRVVKLGPIRIRTGGRS